MLLVPLALPGQSPLALNDLGRATKPIDGDWQFHTGDNLAWASPAWDDSGWQSIQTGKSWEGQGHRDLTGFAWYRRHLTIAPDKDFRLALYLANVEDACDVYWNGELVGSFGKVPPHPSWYARSAPHVFDLGLAQSGVLAIRVWKAPHIYLAFPEEGGLVAVPQVGSTAAVEGLQTAARYRWLRGHQYQLALTLFSALAALLALLAWLSRRDRWMLFWLAIALADPLVSLLIFGIPGLASFRIAYGLVGEVNLGKDIAIWFLLLYLLGLRERRRLVQATRILAVSSLALVAVDSIMVQFDWTRLFPRFFLLADVISTIPATLAELFGVVIILCALRQRLDPARWTLATFVMLSELFVAAFDISGLGQRWTHWTFSDTLSAPLFTVAGNAFTAATVVDTLLLVSLLYAAWRYSEEQGERQSVIEQEFRSAQELQRVLIPEELPALPGYAVTSAYRPAQEVGGDFFQLIGLPGKALLLVIGDVSGKGLRAAMTVSLIVGSIRSTVETTDDPAKVLATLNRRLHGRLQSGFATCLVMRFDAEGNGLIANAGHLPPFVNGKEYSLPPALPLGLIAEAEYEHVPLRLSAGDRVILYTDGLLEARDERGELFGFERIAKLLASQPNAQQISEAAVCFGQDDDITVLTLRRD